LPEVTPAAPAPVDGDVLAPESAAEAAALLVGCGAAGQRVRIAASVGRFGKSPDAGAATKLLSTHKLAGVRVFAPDDLYVTVGAAMPLAGLAEFLAGHGLQAPLAAPWPDATVGGLLAANVNGPLRMRYGGWRDNVLAVTAALGDGRVIRAGRPVVKNVAGYDLAKLFVGSQGTLGVMADVTLKLTPLPRLRQSFTVAVDDVLQGIRWAQATAAHWLMAAGVVVHQDGAGQQRLTFTLEGLPEDVRAEAAEMTAALRRAGARTVEEGGERTATALWCDHLGADDGSLLVRAGVPPQHLALFWQMVAEEARAAGACFVDVAAGLVYVRASGADAATAQRTVEAIRQPALALRGYAVVQDGPADMLAALDRHGYRADGATVADAIRARWDPQGVLVR